MTAVVEGHSCTLAQAAVLFLDDITEARRRVPGPECPIRDITGSRYARR